MSASAVGRSALRRTTSEEVAYHSLRSAIVTGAIAAGSRIVQSDVAARYGMSVTPVREALRRLETEGLIEVAAHRGATVRRLRLAEAQELYELRLVLEPMLVPKAIGALTAERAEASRRLWELMDKTSDVSEFAAYNQEFHEQLLGLDDTWLSRMVQMLRVAAAPYVGVSLHADPGAMARSNAEHEVILEAFVRRDEAAARDLTIRHLEGTMVVLRANLDG